MGIRGMETYLEKHSNAFFPVKIADEIDKARSEGRDTTIVVDGLSCLKFIYGDLAWIHGGQIIEYVEQVKEFIHKFLAMGAQLVFFFDGPPPEAKIETWRKRRVEYSEKCDIFLDHINSGGLVHALGNNPTFTVTPNNVSYITKAILEQGGCQVFNSIDECDEEIVRYACQNGCLAILAQDSDFVIYNGGWHYWSAKHFNLKRMTTMEYSGRKLAVTLSLHTEQLPLLASLLGNDIVPRDDLTTFHRRLAPHYNGRFVSFFNTIQNVARFIRRYPFGHELTPHLQNLADSVFHDGQKWELLQSSVESYTINPERKDDVKHGNEKWDNVLALVRKLHIAGAAPQIYDVIVNGKYHAANSVEDYRLNDVPYNQVIMTKMRHKLYGILLFDKPKPEDGIHKIRELVYSGPNSIEGYVSVPIIPPRVPHPGMAALWTTGDSSMNNVKWDLICDVVGIDGQQLRASNVPSRLVMFLIAMNYLMEEGLKLERFELNALIASAVVLKDHTCSTLKSIPQEPIFTRAIRIYSLILRVIGMLIIVNTALGHPISLKDENPMNYQDGILTQHLYRMAKSGSDVAQLCNNRVDNIEVFNAVMELLPTEKSLI